MTPRPDIVAIRADATLAELRAFFREQEYSRIPVYVDSLDNIAGFVFIKDLMRLPETEPADRRVATLVRPAYVVPETKRVSDLLREFQRQQWQIAIVVDEYGGTAGLVTLEDLLEEIVGEIRDEYDVETEPVVDEGQGRYVVSGKADIETLGERLGVKLEGEGFETVGGYVMARLGRVPAAGEVHTIDDLVVEILDAERRRVHRVRVSAGARRRAGHGAREPRLPGRGAVRMKAGFVALVGRPNAGKSTLLNRLVGQKVAIVSDKPQTTRTRILGVRNGEGGQIVFIDTPGIHRPLHRLNVRMVDVAVQSISQADVVCAVADATEAVGGGDQYLGRPARARVRPRWSSR